MSPNTKLNKEISYPSTSSDLKNSHMGFPCSIPRTSSIFTIQGKHSIPSIKIWDPNPIEMLSPPIHPPSPLHQHRLLKSWIFICPTLPHSEGTLSALPNIWMPSEYVSLKMRNTWISSPVLEIPARKKKPQKTISLCLIYPTMPPPHPGPPLPPQKKTGNSPVAATTILSVVATVTPSGPRKTSVFSMWYELRKFGRLGDIW